MAWNARNIVDCTLRGRLCGARTPLQRGRSNSGETPVMQYPDGFLVELSDGEYALERAPDAVGGYCILRYTPGPPGYVSIVVIKRAGVDDPAGRGCCAHSADEALLPSKPSSETLIEVGN